MTLQSRPICLIGFPEDWYSPVLRLHLVADIPPTDTHTFTRTAGPGSALSILWGLKAKSDLIQALRRIISRLDAVKVRTVLLGCRCELYDHSVATFRSQTKTVRHHVLISSLLDNNKPLQLVTYPLTATCHGKVNFLIVPWMWNRTHASEGKLESWSIVLLSLIHVLSSWFLFDLCLPLCMAFCRRTKGKMEEQWTLD